MLKQGDIIWLDLEPAVGNETKSRRPCLVVSNDDYNHIFNTVITVPISLAKKYQHEDRYVTSPMFVQIRQPNVRGTALLQQTRALDPRKRNPSKVYASLPKLQMKNICTVLSQFY